MQLRRSRNKVVVGEPVAGDYLFYLMFMGVWPSGQRQRIVNPPTFVFVGSNPASPMFVV